MEENEVEGAETRREKQEENEKTRMEMEEVGKKTKEGNDGEGRIGMREEARRKIEESLRGK